MLFSRARLERPSPGRALPGRGSYPFAVPETHLINAHQQYLAESRDGYWGVSCPVGLFAREG